MSRVYRYGPLLALLLVLGGCGDAGRVAVAGKVLFNGAPLESGTITFIPMSGTESPSAGAPISDGSFTVPGDKGPLPGKFRVEIKSPRKTGKKVNVSVPTAQKGVALEETVEAIPPKYNRDSELKADIQPGAPPLEFDLKSK